MAVFTEILDYGAAVDTVWTDEWLETGVNKLMSHELGTHCELLCTQITRKRFLSVTTHVTAQAFHRCIQHQQYTF